MSFAIYNSPLYSNKGWVHPTLLLMRSCTGVEKPDTHCSRFSQDRETNEHMIGLPLICFQYSLGPIARLSNGADCPEVCEALLKQDRSLRNVITYF